VILDHIAGISAEESERGLQSNVVDRLADLSAGLNWLARAIEEIEQTVFARLEQERELFSRSKPLTMVGGKQLSHVDQGMVMCAFHWYAVSVCNYARAVGWFRYGPNKKALDAYVTEVIPEVSVWRNKVAAHYGFTDPRGDNAADFAVFSLPLSFTDQGFTMGATQVALSVQGVTHSSNKGLAPWSVTRVHREVVPRYWPNGPFRRPGGIRPTTDGTFLAVTDLARGGES
jgi:hypothetical protein